MQTVAEDPFELGISVTEAAVLHDRLREAGPVIQATDPDGIPVWVITRYEDVSRLLVDPRIVNKRPGGPSGSPGLKLPPALAANLLNLWPEDHRRIRALAAPAFSRRRVGAVREMIQRCVDELLDAIEPNSAEPVDLMTSLTAPLPVMVITELLGVGSDDAREFRAAAAEVMSVDPSDTASDAVRVPAMTKIVMVLMKVIHEKRAHPGDDVISEWIAARDEEDKLTEEELMSLAFLVFLAGFENSVYQIANAIGVLLGEDRGELLTTLDDEPRWRERVQKLLFEAAPGSFAIRRFPLDDIVVGDVTIPAGSPLYLSLRAATADPERGDRPELFFGRGPHYCLGADLAVMQLDITTRSVFKRFPSLTSAEDLTSLPMRMSWRTHGPVRLPAFTER